MMVPGCFLVDTEHGYNAVGRCVGAPSAVRSRVPMDAMLIGIETPSRLPSAHALARWLEAGPS
jgi:hypothetical protein